MTELKFTRRRALLTATAVAATAILPAGALLAAEYTTQPPTQEKEKDARADNQGEDGRPGTSGLGQVLRQHRQAATLVPPRSQ